MGALAHGTQYQHGIIFVGELKYPADFEHFDYVNPDAPKGGKQISEGGQTFDSLNMFILSGTPAGIGRIYDTLMVSSADEAFTKYC
ncbi:MAG: hypothetical protein V3T15_02930, partial [Pseudomonadales bacterium]